MYANLDRAQKPYAERLAQFLITQPDQFRTLASRLGDKRYTMNQAWQYREFIERNYAPSDFALFDHLPDELDNINEYLFAVFVLGYELLGDAKKPVADVAYEWVNLPFLSKSYIAIQMSMSPQTFDKKLKEIGANRFSIEEIVKLAQLRQIMVDQMRPGVIDTINLSSGE